MIETDSSSQSRRSPTLLPKSMPKASCSRSNQAPPIPSTARPFETWSSVVASFAVRPGFRNVFAPTINPSRTREVIPARPASTVQPSKIGCCQGPWMASRRSHVQIELQSVPDHGLVRRAVLADGRECWVERLLEEGPDALGKGRRRREVHRRESYGRDQERRSPASMGRSSRFSGGASGHDQRGSNAHDGWNEKLKSRTSERVAEPGPRSALFAVSSRYRPAPYVSRPLVASRNGRKRPPP